MTAAVVLVVVQFAAAGGCLALGGRWPRVVAPLAVLAAAAAWVLAVVAAAGHLGSAAAGHAVYGEMPTGRIPIELALRVDALAVLLLVLATSVALAVQLYSVGYLHGEPRYPSYAALVSLFTAAMALVVIADDLFVLLVGWEVMGLCSYFLISHHWERPAARAGAVKAFLMTRLGDIGLLFGIFWLGEQTGSYRISTVLRAAVDGAIGGADLTGAALLVLCGVVGKSAQFPLHTWLPDAMPGPTPISALIHAATMVAAGVFLVARLYDVFLAAPVALAALAVIASITMLGSAGFALAQDDLKRVLAWSTVSQLAYMFGALAVGGHAAAILHLLAHGAFKALLFLCAGAIGYRLGTTSLSAMGGLRRAMPVTFLTMTLGWAALVGLAPFVGFFSKDAVLAAALHATDTGEAAGRWPAALVLVTGLLTVLLTAAYATRAWLLAFFGTASAPAGEAPWLLRGPLVALAVPTVAGGLLMLAPEKSALGPIEQALEPLHPALAGGTSLLLALAGAATYLIWRSGAGDPAASLGRLRPALAREAAVDLAYEAAFVRPVQASVPVVLATDADVVTPYVQGSAGGARLLGGLVRLVQSGNAQTYLTVVVVGAIAIAVGAGILA